MFAGNYESIMEGTYTSDLFAGTDVELLMEALGEYCLAVCVQHQTHPEAGDSGPDNI